MNNILKVNTFVDDLDEDEEDFCVSEDGAMRVRGPGNTCGMDGLCVRPSHKKDQAR